MLDLLLTHASPVLIGAGIILIVMLFTLFTSGGAKRDNVRDTYAQKRRY